jgi:hypothetical protein
MIDARKKHSKGSMMVEWSQKKAWVAVFDILGFKNRIRLADQEFQRALLTGQLDDLFEALEPEFIQNGQLEYVIFSDTIVIFAPDSEMRSYGWFLLQCTKLIERSIDIRLPLRGAISVGTAFLSTSPPIILGPCFLEAHEYCAAQNWIGLLLTPTANLVIRQAGFNPLNHDFVADQIPLRGISSENVLAYRFQNGMSNCSSPLIPLLQEMKHFAPEKDKIKYDRTMSFIEKHYRYIYTGNLGLTQA